MNDTDPPKLGITRIVLVLYTAALLTATHWPGLVVHGPVNWTDKIIHCGVFCIWTCLLYITGWVGGPRRLLWTGVAGVCYAVFDETTQPMFSRVFDWLDLLADTVGVLLGLGLIAAGRRFWPVFRGDLGE